MYCARCGKQIEDDSTFCPFCGQQVNGPVINTKPTVDVGYTTSVKKGISGQAKKWIIGVIAGLAAVTGVIIGAVKIVNDSEELVEDTVTYRLEQEETGLRVIDTLTLNAKGDRVVELIETFEIDMSSYDEAKQKEVMELYDGVVEVYASVDGVECTGSTRRGIYTINITVDTTGDAVSELAFIGLWGLEENSDELSLQATAESLKEKGYRLVK